MSGFGKQIIGLFVLGMFFVVSAQAATLREHCNGFHQTPTPDGHSFTMILQGDETSYVDATATANSTVVDPFTYVNKVIVGSGTSTVNVSLIGGNPDVVFTGSNPSLPSYHFMYGPHSDGEPHFGLEPLSNGVKCDYVSEDGTMFPSSRRFR